MQIEIICSLCVDKEKEEREVMNRFEVEVYIS